MCASDNPAHSLQPRNAHQNGDVVARDERGSSDAATRGVAVIILGSKFVELLETGSLVLTDDYSGRNQNRREPRRQSNCHRETLMTLSMYPSPLSTHYFAVNIPRETSVVSKEPSMLQELVADDDLTADGFVESDYHRFQNVIAAPLQIDSNYVAPVNAKSDADRLFLDRCLSDNFIFCDMTPEERDMFIGTMSLIHVQKGDVIIKQGDLGDYFYILRDGRVTFLVDDVEVGEGEPGECFGELALLYNSARAATVRSDAVGALYRVDQQTFRNMMANKRRKDSREHLEMLKKLAIFAEFDTLILSKISDIMAPASFKAGDVIFRRGDEASILYILQEGQVALTDVGTGGSRHSRYVDQTICEGEMFGALQLHNKIICTATATQDVKSFRLSRRQLEGIVGCPIREAIAKLVQRRYLQTIPVITKARLSPLELDELEHGIVHINLRKGEELTCSGPTNKIGALCVIRYGKICITHQSGHAKLLSHGDYFLREEVNDAKKIVAADDSRCSVIRMDVFERIVGDRRRRSPQDSQEISCELDLNIQLSDLRKHRVLGQGTFGTVWLVSHQTTERPYALKVQNKRNCIKMAMVDKVINEKNIMTRINHPFILKLVSTFQDTSCVYILMKMVHGGELFNVIHRKKSHGIREPSAQFYTACVVAGLRHLHGKQILYRDLKPENVLIDSEGYCVLVDLGYAKVVTNKTYTLCGTPLYMAPEVIIGRGYDTGVDFWALGVLIYEMLIGYSPFYARGLDQVTLFKRIVRRQYYFPRQRKCSDAAQDLISRLLVSPTERLGSLARGDVDVVEHDWLCDVPMNALLSKDITAPWVPTIKNPLDASNFEDWNRKKNKHDSGSKKPLSKREQKLFREF